MLRADAEALVDAYAQADDVESGAWLLARLHRPRFDHRAYGAPQLDGLAEQIRAAVQCGASADSRTVAMHLGHACGFSGDRETYDDPQNSFLPCVLERRLGLPIALTVLWLAVCRRLGFAADAIALPGHVLGRWSSGPDEAAAHGYLDLFNRGAAVARHELDLRARLAGEASAQPYLAAASDRALLRRMARNLALSYVRRGDQLRATIAHGMATA